ncbi:MazG nucleotide pyrophosphohydrolase domain-containing protein [Cupriavidus necator]
MNFEQYAPLALRTAKPLPRDEQIQHAQLGLVTEVGELADAVKRHVIYGKDLDITNFVEEVGDVMWYVNLLVDQLAIHPRVISRLIEESFGEETGEMTLVTQVLLTASITGALASYQELEENPQAMLAVVIEGLVHLLKRFDRKLDEAMEANVNKLAKRYGDKYSDYAALNRDVDAERAGLEADVGA